MTAPVMVTDEGAVRIIRLNRPEKKNALTLAMYADMARALSEADQSDAIRCGVIAGVPGAFCAGNDITDFLKASSGGLDPRAHEFLHALARRQKPLVAAVDGVAIGVGTTMLFHCDHVVAGSGATLSTPFLKLGLIPEAGSTLLAPMRMGYARAFSLLVMGRPLTAAEAKDAGIVNTVVDSAEVDATALKAAQEIAALPPKTLAVARGLMRGHLDEVIKQIDTEAVHFRDLLQSDEARAAFAAFLAAESEAIMSLQGKTLFITGASRGIGLAIGLRAARDGANVAIAAKTAEPHPKLPGTIYTAAEEIEKAGGKALPLVVDVRDEAQVNEAVDSDRRDVRRHRHLRQQCQRHLADRHAATTDMKRYDLMHQINTRGTFVVSKMCIPHLKKAANPHILMISPPLDMKANWFAPHIAYTMAKFGMSMCVLGHGRRVRGKRHRRQRAVAAHRDRHRGGQEPPRRRQP